MRLFETKKTIILALIISLSLLILALAYKNRYYLKGFMIAVTPNTLVEVPSEPVFASITIQNNLKNNQFKKFKHYKLSIWNTNNLNINPNVIADLNDSIPIIVTIETWSSNKFYSLNNNILAELINGKFDNIIKEFCTEIIGTRSNVYFRLNPEMEVPFKSYPWQGYLNEYIEAFQYFSLMCKNYAPQVKQIWGPAGYPGVLELYPGDEVVDAVSITLQSEGEKRLNVYPSDYPIAYELKRKIHRLRFVNKPIFIIGSKTTNKDAISSEEINLLQKDIESERGLIYSDVNYTT